jgi:Rab-GTPase-TBC domain
LFAIFRLLLRYHSPQITSIFEDNLITPNIYATSWFITIFSSKTLDLFTLFTLWEEIIKEKDRLFTCYIAVAVLEYFKIEILNEIPDQIPQKILSIRLNSISETNEIISKARYMKQNMPYSLHANLMRYDVFKLNTIDSILSTLNKEICLSVHARDVILRMYPEAKLCHQCSDGYCRCFPSKNEVNFIVIDCRTETEQQAGKLPNSDLLSEQAYLNMDYLLELPKLYSHLKGLFHISLMGTGAFKPAEDFSSDSENEEEKDYVQNMLENLLKVFLINGFPYVSIVEGGFQKIHEFAMHYQLTIEKHSRSSCLVCSPEGPKYNNIFKNGLKRIGDSLAAFKYAVKSIVRSDTIQLPNTEEVKVQKRKAITRRSSLEPVDGDNTK